MKLPNVKKPCKDCPFRKDIQQGWLGESRMAEILQSNTFTCHKTEDPNRLQSAGHMIIKGDKNQFVGLAKLMNIDLGLSGQEIIFETEQDCINHHKH